MDAVTILIIAKTKKYKQIFITAGATSSDAAIQPAAYGIRQSPIFNKLVRDGVFCAVGHNRFYMDEKRDKALTRKRRTVGLIVLLVIVVALLIGVYTGS